ncbi:MAG: pre-peptidase C-terminal domain-containing protein [Planctomycetota bacterium]
MIRALVLAQLCFAFAISGLSGHGFAQTFDGVLEADDAQLPEGEYYDIYTFEVEPGQAMTARVESDEFDTYIMVRSPSDQSTENDDLEDSNASEVVVDITEGGTWRVIVTSYAGGETGEYTLSVSFSGEESSGDQSSDEQSGEEVTEGESGQEAPVEESSETGEMAQEESVEEDSHQEEAATPEDRGDSTDETADSEGEQSEDSTSGDSTVETRIEEGELEAGDPTLDSGEYCDYFQFDGEAGEQVTVDLRAEGFDPYLILEYPGGDEQQDNDDHAGSQTRSLISMTLPASGSYKIIVTSYAVNEVGSYTLTITQGGEFENANRTENGTLERGDDELDSGEYVDYHVFQGRRDQRVHLDLHSSEFDTYLMLVTPSGRQFFNDDVEDQPQHSIIDSYLPEEGMYSIGVTSYEPGEAGNYELKITVEDISVEDIIAVELGDEVEATLSDEDAQLGNSYVDVYSLEAEEGQFVQVDLISPEDGSDPEIDTMLNIVAPSGETFSNDDFADGSTNSRITFSVPETGHYRIEATSYSEGETGRYTVSVREPDAIAKGRIRGVFVGISDYDDKENYLEYCNADATRVSNALIENYGMELSDAVILTDRIATVENLENVLDRMAEEVGPDDTFVFFFSGHAEQQNCEHPQAADIDGNDEALMLVDGKMLDDTLNTKLNAIDAAVQVIVIDACFAGGFARDIITEGDRIGFFSSEDDITSGVAESLKAGGYLAKFFADALTDGSADENNDGAITSMELRIALRDLYHKHRHGMDNQELVIDRGNVDGKTILLFRR